ncbi:MFS transporter [Vibrio nereis]|uniref:Acyl-phosphate glycerol 3-phosphate acyltransferase n=1 Tax=Vibrio nereis TaxID=693 RepID=A0A0M0HPN8_VIBNE|nr:MFS transporter [Vibrio nereis]KOO03623.1 acyl-phosphate glycerol 3-phosphate acyltransferase [Vibrio nereis]
MFTSRRFLPYFITQCLGALNDNVYKNILLLMVTYQSVEMLPLPAPIFVNLAAGLFILPFVLFSAHAGHVADNMDKAKLIRLLKSIEVIVMTCAALAIFTQNYWAMLALLLLTGTQSAYFGPVKYALLPQALKSKELVSGNAWVEMGTFISILLGTISAGVLLSLAHGQLLAGLLIFTLSLLGWLSSLAIPSLPSLNGEKTTAFKWHRGTQETIRIGQQNRGVWMAILAISWFWFLGATYLTQFPNFAKQHLMADGTVVSILLALFSIGIAFGSWVCEKLSFKQVELGILPFGILGLTLFGLDMLHALPSLPQVSAGEQWQALDFIQHQPHWRLMFDLFMVGVSGGIFIVPLYAYIQSRAKAEQRARTIAANNIMNALFMVISAGFAIAGFTYLEWSVVDLFLAISIINLVVAVFVYLQVPEFTLRFISYLLSYCLYRVRISGRDQIPDAGGVLLVANHVSYVDALILMGVSPRPVRFVMHKGISEIPVLKYGFRHANVIPICSPKQCQETYKQAFESINDALDNGEVVCIFPEGSITRHGEVNTFRPGVEKILANRPVPVIPIGINGLWGSFFSHQDGHAFTKRPKRFWSRIHIKVGEQVDGAETNRADLQQRVELLTQN